MRFRSSTRQNVVCGEHTKGGALSGTSDTLPTVPLCESSTSPQRPMPLANARPCLLVNAFRALEKHAPAVHVGSSNESNPFTDELIGAGSILTVISILHEQRTFGL